MIYWRLLIFIATGVTAAVFCGHFVRMLKYKKARPAIKLRGSQKQGEIYALTRGLLPREKESTRRHPLVYATGIIYHTGIFGGFLWLASLLFSLSFPREVRSILSAVIILAAVAGIGLLGRRVFSPWLRQLSFPDDFAANLLVDAFLVMAAISIIKPEAKFMFLAISLLVILYLPLGKIRHCLLFFPSRLIFGRYFGQRGILPPNLAAGEKKRGGVHNDLEKGFLKPEKLPRLRD